MVLRGVVVGLLLGDALGCARTTPVIAPTVVYVEGVARAAPVETSGPSVATSSWSAKEEVEVEWHGSWWPAIVMEKRGQDRWLVHYQGYGDDWDEVVGADRIRERRAEAQVEDEEREEEPDP